MATWLVLLGGCGVYEGPLGINEVAPAAVDGPTDTSGEADPWVEVFNDADEPADLAGWSVELGGIEWVLGEIEIPAGSMRLLWLDGSEAQGVDHAPFALTEDGGDIEVRDASGATLQVIEVPPLTSGESYGRVPDGVANWQILDEPTPGTFNAP